MHETNPATGLMRDKTDPDAPASMAAVGPGLASIPILVERGVIAREFAPEIALRPLRFFRDSPQGPEPDATGYRGFYYHFLDMKTGHRVWQCELSTIDSAFLFAGMLTCAAYSAITHSAASVVRICPGDTGQRRRSPGSTISLRCGPERYRSKRRSFP